MDIVQTVTSSLQKHLGKELDDLARECRVVHREREFTGQSLLLMIVLTLLRKPDASWRDFHLTAGLLGVEVTQTAVEKRLAAGQPLVDFLRAALERALQQSLRGEEAKVALFQRFTAVLLGDSTTIALPDELADVFLGCGDATGSSRAALKLQVQWDLKTNSVTQLHIEPGRASDAKSPIAVDHADPGTLLVYDLGYFDLSRFAALDKQNAKYISRFQHGTAVFDDNGVPLNLVAYLRTQTTTVVDREVLVGASDRLSCRLIAIRMPEEVANRRRQKAQEKAQKKGRSLSAEYLELLGWSIFLTNCPAEDLTWKAVVVLYRARWQIELLFKLWKSHNHLARGRKGACALEVLANFYAKLLGVLLQHWILAATAKPSEGQSLLKAARVLSEMVREILLPLADREQVAKQMQRLQKLIQQLARITRRKKNPSHAQLIEDPELLDWAA